MTRVLCSIAVALSAAAADGPAGKRYAVVVGVNEYRHPKLPTLKFAENDAAELATLLRDRGYEVVALTGTAGAADPALAPTKANIEAKLAAALAKCGRGDVVVVALAGHGLQFQGQADAYFCPADGKPFPDEAATLVSLARVYAGLDKSFAGMKVLLVDACRDDPTSTRGVDADSAPRPPQGVACLFSCRAGERAFEHDTLQHGVFFHHVLEGLKGHARDTDGDVTFAGLASYVSRRVSRDVPQLIGGGAKQSPNLKADYATEPVLVSAGATATPAGDEVMPADAAGRVVADAVRAHGGFTALRKYVAGDCEFEGRAMIGDETYPVRCRSAYHTPDKLYSRIVFDAAGVTTELVQVAAGDEVWQAIDGKPQPLTDETRVELTRSLLMQEVTQLAPLLDRTARYALTAAPDGTAGGRPAAVVVATVDRPKFEVRLFFDKQTKLLVRTEREAFDVVGGKPVTEASEMSDFVAVRGVQVPRTTVLYRHGKVFTSLTVKSPQLLEKADESLFRIPK